MAMVVKVAVAGPCPAVCDGNLPPMDALALPYAGVAFLLVPSGVAKLARPTDTVRALRAQHWPAGVAAVRGLGVAELAIAVGAFALPARIAGPPLALLYAGFALFVVRALASGGPLASCGCFGRADTPPTLAHVAIDVAAAACAALAALDDLPRPTDAAPVAVVVPVGIALAVLCAMALGVRPARTGHAGTPV
jgi:hypothetical protein